MATVWRSGSMSQPSKTPLSIQSCILRWAFGRRSLGDMSSMMNSGQRRANFRFCFGESVWMRSQEIQAASGPKAEPSGRKKSVLESNAALRPSRSAQARQDAPQFCCSETSSQARQAPLLPHIRLPSFPLGNPFRSAGKNRRTRRRPWVEGAAPQAPSPPRFRAGDPYFYINQLE
jgi:hypothetical protein